MKNITPIRDKVLGRMLDMVGGIQTSEGGLLFVETDMTLGAIMARWFAVTHVGPDQKDIDVGDIVLVPHGRWSRGIDIDGSYRDEDKIFLIDHRDIMGKQY